MTPAASSAGPLPWPLRVELWDAALGAVRRCLRDAGMREVSTPIRVAAVALEPWIEPIAAGRDRWLATSPELSMKALLARGGGSMFQIAHVFRAAEIGARHMEEFHLIEWYRTPGDLPAVQADVEALVAAVFAAVDEVFAANPSLAPAERPSPPARWERVEVLGLMGETLDCELAGNEAPEALKAVLDRVRARAGVRLAPRESGRDTTKLEAWTELFSLWSDLELEPWLAARPAGTGVHTVGFPAPLAALSALDPGGATAGRFESHLGSHLGPVELANGYRELADAEEQRRRFERVAELRAAHGLAKLPMPEAFLAELDALPPCAGVALGLDRLLALAVGCARLDHLALAPL